MSFQLILFSILSFGLDLSSLFYRAILLQTSAFAISLCHSILNMLFSYEVKNHRCTFMNATFAAYVFTVYSND